MTLKHRGSRDERELTLEQIRAKYLGKLVRDEQRRVGIMAYIGPHHSGYGLYYYLGSGVETSEPNPEGMWFRHETFEIWGE